MFVALLAALSAVVASRRRRRSSAARPGGDHLAAQVDRDRARRRGQLRAVGRADARPGRLTADVEPDQPRESGADLLALPLPGDARPDPRGLRRGRALGGAARRGRSRCCASTPPSTSSSPTTATCAGGSATACWSPAPAAAAASWPRRALPGDRAGRPREDPDRGRGGELLSGDRGRFSLPVYEATQSAIHVLVTHAFLRSLATLDLAKSKVGDFAAARDRAAPRRDRRSDARPRPPARWPTSTPPRPRRPLSAGRGGVAPAATQP